MNESLIQKISAILILVVVALVLLAFVRLVLDNIWYVLAILAVVAGAAFIVVQVKKGSD